MGSSGSAEAEERVESAVGEKRGRVGRVVEWVKVDGDRLLLTAGISVLVFACLLLLNAFGVVAFSNDDSVTRMASGMIAGSFSLVTLVVSVNQLILSQEFSPAGKARDQFDGVMEFRRDIEDGTGVSTTPVEPTRILEVLTEAIARRANELARAAETHPDGEFRRRVQRYTTNLEESAEWMDEQFDESDVEAFDALSVAVQYDTAWHISAARSLRNGGPELTEEMSASVDELVETLRLFTAAQEHFKTVYLQRELTRFSQLTIYTGVPAVVSAALIILVYGEINSSTLLIGQLPYVVSLLVTAVFVPLALLAAYILRTATLTRRTASTGPMLLEDADKERPGDVADGGAD